MKNLQTIFKIAKLTPIDQGNLEPGTLYSGIYGLEIHGDIYLEENDAMSVLASPRYQDGLKPGESYTILKLYKPGE